MAKLTDSQKLFVVQRLACFYTPTEVRQELQLQHGLDVPLNQVCFYDPASAEGQRLSAELKQAFDETRKRFLDDVMAIPIANQAYRLRRLQEIIDDPRHRKNPQLVRGTMEQAAKEVGGFYTNRREVSGPDGGPIAVDIATALEKVYGGGDATGAAD